MPKAVRADHTGARVVSVGRDPGSDFCLMRLEAPDVAAAAGGARPGQFVMLRAFSGVDPLLARPLAVFDLPEDAPGCVDLLFAVVGRGTRIFEGLAAGDRATVLGPLGNGWRLEGAGEAPAVLVGGGCGVAALYWAARRLAGSRGSAPVTLVTAGRTAAQLLPKRLGDRLAAAGVRIVTATDDGSEGLHGTALDALAEVLDALGGGAGDALVLASGPKAMLAAAARLAAERGVALQVSLEERMACGVGVCRGCVVKALAPHPETGLRTRTVCADGPVFDAAEIDWEGLG